MLKIPFLALIFLAGIACDFIFVGVFKVIWIAIYGTTYFALAMTLETMLSRSKYREWRKLGLYSFLGGAILAHLVFVGHHRRDTYAMTLISENPLVLKAAEFPEFVYLSSDKVSAALHGPKKEIVMETDTLVDYGCRKSFSIESIAAVPIRVDTNATWTLRSNKVGTYTTEILPSMNDKDWIWCKIQFYRQ